MAPKTPVSLVLTDVMRELYVEAKHLVMVDGGITAEERVLADRLFTALEFSIRTHHAVKNSVATIYGHGGTAHQARTERELEQEIAHLKDSHNTWIASLETGGRLYIPLGQRTAARECESRTA